MHEIGIGGRPDSVRETHVGPRQIKVTADAALGETAASAKGMEAAAPQAPNDLAIPQGSVGSATIAVRRKLQPILAILALHTVFVCGHTSFSLRPHVEQRLGPVGAVCLLGLVFGIWVTPAALRWNRNARGLPFFSTAGLLRLPLILLCLNYLPVFLFGYEPWLRVGALRHVSNFAQFAAFPLMYQLFYGYVPRHRRGLWLGIAMTFELILWRSVSDIAARMTPVVPGETHPLLPYVFWGWLGGAALLSLLLCLTFFRGREAVPALAPPDAVHFPEMEERRSKSRIALVMAASACMYMVSGTIAVKQAPSLTLLTFPLPLDGLRLIALLAIPLAGWWLDRNALPVFRAICLLCGGIFVFAPVMTILHDTPEIMWGIATLVELAHYVAILAFSMVLGGVVRPGDGIRRWPAILIFTRTAMDICFWLFRTNMAIPIGVAVLLGMVFAFAFLGVTYLLSSPPRGPAKKDSGADFDAFLDSKDLTGRQREVAVLILRGLSTREIAETLAIAEPTVKIHVRKTLEKFDCNTRKAFVAKWLDEIGGGGRTP